MYLYEWDKEGVISRMEVRSAYRGVKEAVLFTHPDTPPDRLYAVRKLCHSMGFTVTPGHQNGEQVLRVRGFRRKDFLAGALESNGIQPLHSAKISRVKEKDESGFVARVRTNSLKLTGWIWMVGDAVMILSGLRRGDKNEAFSGMGNASTSLIAAGWGNRKMEHICDDMYDRLTTELATEGYRLPHGREATIRQVSAKGGLLARVEQFLYDYPAQVITAINVIGGYHLYRAGRTQKNMDKSLGGFLVMVGMLTGLLVPEKSRAEKWEEQAAADSRLDFTLPRAESATGIAGVMQKAWNFVRERPLRIGGYLSIANNMLMMKGAFREKELYAPRFEILIAAAQGKWKEARQFLDAQGMAKATAKEREDLAGLLENQDRKGAQKALKRHEKSKGGWYLNLVAGASYLVGNGLFSMSSSRTPATGEEGKDPNAPLYDMAAMFILQQPENLRATVLDKVVADMAKHKGIDIHPQNLKEKISARLDEVARNPWFKAGKNTSSPTWQEREKHSPSSARQNLLT